MYRNLVRDNWEIKESITDNQQKEKTLILRCDSCKITKSNSGNYLRNKTCGQCLFSAIDSNRDVSYIKLMNMGVVPTDDLEAIKSFLAVFDEIREDFNQHPNNYIKSCSNFPKSCPAPRALLLTGLIDKIDPYTFLQLVPAFSDSFLIPELQGNCSNCSKIMRKKLLFIQKKIQTTDLTRKILYSSGTGTDILEELPPILLGPTFDDIKKKRYEFVEYYSPKAIYTFGPEELFSVQILDIPNRSGSLYSISVNIPKNVMNLISEIRNSIFLELDKSESFESFDFGTLLENRVRKIYNIILAQYPAISNRNAHKLSIMLAAEYLHISKLFPLLLDPRIEEIFLDCPYSTVYLNHRDFARCETEISFNASEIDAIKTYIRISSKKRLDLRHPSIVYTMNNAYFNCRFSIDVAPIQYDGFSLDIRKMNKEIFSLPELIALGTLSPAMAAILYFSVRKRINITVVGETDSGKTTLINALDLLVPCQFRKIYVEDAVESLPQINYDLHQLKYQVDPDAEDQKSSKAREITKLLHRSPDVVYLGEILTKSEAEAMFHCLAAGLRGFQTIHAYNLESLLNRWQIHFNISPICFNDLGLVVNMIKIEGRRLVKNISEVWYENGNINIHNIFVYNPQTRCWDVEVPYIYSRAIQKIRKIIDVSDESILSELELFEKIFAQWSINRFFDVESQIKEMNSIDNKLREYFVEHSNYGGGYVTYLARVLDEWMQKYITKYHINNEECGINECQHDVQQQSI